MARIKKTLGGDRLGSGNKMKVSMRGFGRSTHNIGRTFKTDQACGTLVPCFVDVATNGTDYYIKLDTLIRTLPTNGPIFGSFKHQIDVFIAPIRLYNAQLHNNALNIGRHMERVMFPLVKYAVQSVFPGEGNTEQVAQDSLTAYLGLRGFGYKNSTTDALPAYRTFPALFELMYWDTYKNYFANKQEEIGYVITPNQTKKQIGVIQNVNTQAGSGSSVIYFNKTDEYQKTAQTTISNAGSPDTTSKIRIIFQYDGTEEQIEPPTREEFENKQTIGKFSTFKINGTTQTGYTNKYITIKDFVRLTNAEITETQGTTKYIKSYQILTQPKSEGGIEIILPANTPITENIETEEINTNEIALTKFELENIDEMREMILAAPKSKPFVINTIDKLPYKATWGSVLTNNMQEPMGNACYYPQAGLGIKTYLSDRFNNWMSTDWIDGENGINELTAVQIVDGKLSMDALLLQEKMYNMMNRIALGDGTYHDWQEVMYGQRVAYMPESPIYCGGMSSEIVFEEVVSTADAGENDPLGSLAGRGADRRKKGENNMIHVHVPEPSILMIIESITPRVDYSQGNKWYMNLRTMDDLHKPGLDQIGFQDLITEEIAAFDTVVKQGTDEIERFSAGKQPSWIQYMTNVDESYGDFAFNPDKLKLQYMVLNRGYEQDENGRIKDLTTYIDPVKYNTAFADAKLTAKNFWVQVAINCKVRRVMSAKQIPSF